MNFFSVTSISIDFQYKSILIAIGGLNRLISDINIDFNHHFVVIERVKMRFGGCFFLCLL